MQVVSNCVNRDNTCLLLSFLVDVWHCLAPAKCANSASIQVLICQCYYRFASKELHKWQLSESGRGLNADLHRCALGLVDFSDVFLAPKDSCYWHKMLLALLNKVFQLPPASVSWLSPSKKMSLSLSLSIALFVFLHHALSFIPLRTRTSFCRLLGERIFYFKNTIIWGGLGYSEGNDRRGDSEMCLNSPVGWAFFYL